MTQTLHKSPFAPALAPAALLAALLIAGCGSSNSGHNATKSTPESASAGGVKGAIAATQAGDQLAANASPAVQAAVKDNGPRIVAITVHAGSATRTGSATIFARDELLTDARLVATSNGQSVGQVNVVLPSGRVTSALVDGVDPLSGLAALRLTDPVPTAPSNASSATGALGAPVVALARTATRNLAVRSGEVTLTGRTLKASGVSQLGLFETSATLGAQGAGAPISASNGAPVGIATRVMPATGPVSTLVIPWAQAIRIGQALKIDGRMGRPYLGLTPVTITPSMAESLGLQTSGGVLVRYVTPGGPAVFGGLTDGKADSAPIPGVGDQGTVLKTTPAKATPAKTTPATSTKKTTPKTTSDSKATKVTPTTAASTPDLFPTSSATGIPDAIVAIDGIPLHSAADLTAAIAAHKPGDTVVFTVIRGNRSLKIHVRLSDRVAVPPVT